MEMFIGDPETGSYYQFAFDYGCKVLYDGKNYDGSWNSDKWKVVSKPGEDCWYAIVTIPLDMIDCNVTVNPKLLFLPIRGKYYDREFTDKKTGEKTIRRVREMASWGGGWVHEVVSFGEILLEN
jgi:hypothetical protein